MFVQSVGLSQILSVNCVCVSVSSERGESFASLQSAPQQQDVPADLHPHSGGSEVVLHERPRERRLAAHGCPAGACL